MAHTYTFPAGSLTLNDEQSTIVRQSPTQNMRILASAGSGKTTTLTGRIAWLLTEAGATADQIILLTFTHNAAAVMRTRLEGLVGSQRILCGTFHALSQQILSTHHPTALNDVYHVDELPLKALDWLATPAGREWIHTLRWIFIDEFQDINDTQYAFIRALHHDKATVTIVGDDAQNIYTWRGSCVDYILNFHRSFSDVADFQLSTNYRSAASIVAVANSIMRYIPTLDHKELMMAAPHAPVGDRPTVNYFARTAEERDWVCEAAVHAMQTGSTVILSKFNSVLYAYEAALMKMGVRVRFVQGEGESVKVPPTVFLATFHGSKGLEWDHVFLVRMNDEVFPQQKDEDSILQERRLFYVAVTRARRSLTFSYSRHEKSLSRFVREVHRPLLQWRGLPNYEISTLSSQIAPMNVGDWVNYLAGDDYRTIKSLQVLPAAFSDAATLLATAVQPKVRDQYVVPYWWTEQGMINEFFDFLRAYWLREVACIRPESGGQWDRDAQQIIWTVKIAAEDATTFERHRDLFADLMERFFGSTTPGDAPPQIYYTEIIAAMGLAAKTLEQTELIRVIQIIHKMRTMLYNLRFASVALSDLRFAPIRHTPPQETRCSLIEAWRAYTNGQHHAKPEPTTDEFRAVYLIGLCRALADGRSGVLTALPGEREWARCREFLRAFRERATATTAHAKTVLCRVQAEVVEGIVATADMIVDETAWFFVGGETPTELQRLERMVVVLLTVHALRQAGYTIREVCLYQMLTGQELRWAVDTWPARAASLLTAFIQARVQHTVATAST